MKTCLDSFPKVPGDLSQKKIICNKESRLKKPLIKSDKKKSNIQYKKEENLFSVPCNKSVNLQEQKKSNNNSITKISNTVSATSDNCSVNETDLGKSLLRTSNFFF